MSKSCVCETCKEEYEEELRKKGYKKYSDYKGTVSRCYPTLDLYYFNDNNEEQYLMHFF